MTLKCEKYTKELKTTRMKRVKKHPFNRHIIIKRANEMTKQTFIKQSRGS